jgi:hypothetical protein
VFTAGPEQTEAFTILLIENWPTVFCEKIRRHIRHKGALEKDIGKDLMSV